MLSAACFNFWLALRWSGSGTLWPSQQKCCLASIPSQWTNNNLSKQSLFSPKAFAMTLNITLYNTLLSILYLISVIHIFSFTL